jgi:class 3 adenylate cyclase
MEEAEFVLPGLPIGPEGWRSVLLALRRGRSGTSPMVAEVRGRIAGERKYLTILCADLQRSADLISELDPEAAISRLEPALMAMRTADRRNRGIVSKEGGDGLIALFGAPHADDNHAVMACHAAAELVRRVKLLNDPALHREGDRNRARTT